MAGNLNEFNDSNFEEKVLKSEKITVVDFWAVWCQPCKMIAPSIEAIANEMSDVNVGKLNVDDNPVVASKYGIMSIPTVAIFKNGEMVDNVVGAVPKAMIEQVIKKYL